MRTSHSSRGRPLIQNYTALRRERVAAGLSQLKLAELAEISRAHMSAVELGQKSASPEVLARLAHALGCKPIDLMAEELVGQ